MAARTIGEIIDKAIEENRPSEYLLYSFSAVFIMLGCVIISFGIYQKDNITALLGAIPSALFVPAVLLGERVRNRNMALRTLEIVLMNSGSADEAALALRMFFLSVFTIHLPDKTAAAHEAGGQAPRDGMAGAPINDDGAGFRAARVPPRDGDEDRPVDRPPHVTAEGQL